MATQSLGRITEDEYLALERAAERKSEFVDGEIFAMAGGSLRHSRAAIREHLKRLEVLETEERDRKGYRIKPQGPSGWELEAIWPAE